MRNVVVGGDSADILRDVYEAPRHALALSRALGKGAALERGIINATEVDRAAAGTALRALINRVEVLVPRRSHASSRLEVRVDENAAVTWQCKACVFEGIWHRLLRIVDERVSNVLVVDLVLFRDVKRFLK